MLLGEEIVKLIREEIYMRFPKPHESRKQGYRLVGLMRPFRSEVMIVHGKLGVVAYRVSVDLNPPTAV
jgi:hypothetical protein